MAITVTFLQSSPFTCHMPCYCSISVSHRLWTIGHHQSSECPRSAIKNASSKSWPLGSKDVLFPSTLPMCCCLLRLNCSAGWRRTAAAGALLFGLLQVAWANLADSDSQSALVVWHSMFASLLWFRITGPTSWIEFGSTLRPLELKSSSPWNRWAIHFGMTTSISSRDGSTIHPSHGTLIEYTVVIRIYILKHAPFHVLKHSIVSVYC